jgi:DNA-binding winged helix-turn-helix (wHTH) protein/tetratricopeptide (TPR) repeat protein
MTIYRFGPFRLEREQLLLLLDGMPLPLGPKVVETLLALIEHPGEVLGKSELLQRIWPEGFVEEANLAQNIYVIRKTLRAHWDCTAIETVPRRGYRFTGAVSVELCAGAHVAQPAVTVVQSAPPRRRSSLRVFAGAALAAVMAIGIAAGTMDVARSRPAGPSTRGLSVAGARLYSMGKYYWNQRTPESVAKSERYFTQVIQSDPKDARGYAGLASAYAIAGDYRYAPLSRSVALSRAADYAHRALQLDRNCAEAYAVLGLVAVDTRHAREGQAQYRRAIALDPNYAPAHQWYGTSLLMSGKGEAAFEELQKAADLDPESVAATDWLSQAAYMARRYKDALYYAHQALDLSPSRNDVYQTIGLAEEALGDYHAAVSAYQTYGNTCENCRYQAAALLAHVYAISHEEQLAREELSVAELGITARRIAPENVVAALAAMGRLNDAMRMLRHSKSAEPGALLAIDPRMAALHSDVRFRQLTQSPG